MIELTSISDEYHIQEWELKNLYSELMFLCPECSKEGVLKFKENVLKFMKESLKMHGKIDVKFFKKYMLKLEK